MAINGIADAIAMATKGKLNFKEKVIGTDYWHPDSHRDCCRVVRNVMMPMVTVGYCLIIRKNHKVPIGGIS